MLAHAPWGGRLDGMAVLDAFAGTGALGLEALSRGAATASFIEQDQAALAALRFNVAACAGARAQVIAANVLRPPPGLPCQLIFLDPPYHSGLLLPAVTALAAKGWLRPASVIVAECARPETPQLGKLLAERDHGAGRITVWSWKAELAG